MSKRSPYIPSRHDQVFFTVAYLGKTNRLVLFFKRNSYPRVRLGFRTRKAIELIQDRSLTLVIHGVFTIANSDKTNSPVLSHRASR